MKADILSLIIIAVCIILSAYFSSTETAFSSLNRIRMKNLAENGNKRAGLVMKLYGNYDKLLSTILIGNNIVNIAASALATVIFVRILGEGSGSAVSIGVITVLVLFFGEITPKSLAKEFPEKFAMFSAPFLSFLVTVLTPVNYIFVLWKKLVTLLFHSNEDASITEEELLTIVDEAEQEGGIDEQESELIRSAIEFNELEAIDIFTPRVDVVGIPAGSTKEEIAKVFIETGYSRLPVYEESLDNIIGIIHQKDFHNKVYHTDLPLDAIIHPAIYITKTMKIDDLLSHLQKAKSHFAVITDEYGGTEGIVTMEDILEELVGEIWDEHDEVVEEFQQLSENRYKVLGSANVDKMFEFFDIEGEADSSSVSGWAMEQIGEIPKVGDAFDYKNLSAVVHQVENKRVLEIIVTVHDPVEEEDDQKDD